MLDIAEKILTGGIVNNMSKARYALYRVLAIEIRINDIKHMRLKASKIPAV